jgi:hypothetical protein
VPEQSAVEQYLETQRRGYHTTPAPPEMRLQQAGWSIRQEWIAEKDGQTVRAPSTESLAAEVYRREDLASDRRARQAERSRIAAALKSLRIHADAFGDGWETYKANTVEVERPGKVVKLNDGSSMVTRPYREKRSHSKALKGLDSCSKALRGIHETVARLKDDPALERYPEALALIERLREWGKAA